MGKLGGLLSAGIGLAVEAAQSPRSDPRGLNSQRPGQNRPSSSYGPNCSQLIDWNPRQKGQRRRSLSAYTSNETTYGPSRTVATSGDTKNSRHQEYPIPYEEPPPSYEDSEFGRDVSNMPPRWPQSSGGHLPYPIIIPQRRPQEKDRGWVMAYAPVLDEFGIDQHSFLEILHDFNESSKSSPYLDAVNLAALGVGFAPGIAPIVVSTVVPIAVQCAKKIQTDRRTDSYLDRTNRDFFEPRGLFALVMTVKPGQKQCLTIDTNSTSANIVGGRTDSGYYAPNGYDDNYGVPEMPECAPLVFPCAQDIAMVRPHGNRLREMAHFTADYFDKRAQARYAQENPHSALTMQDIRFRSAWGDPRKVNGSSGLIGILSGGAISREIRPRNSRRDRRRAGKTQGGLIKSLKAKASMSTDILYLMIVERPSDDDMLTPELPLRRSPFESGNSGSTIQQDVCLEQPQQFRQDQYTRAPLPRQEPPEMWPESVPANVDDRGFNSYGLDRPVYVERRSRSNNPFYTDRK